jgi:hypothetical protein
LLPAPGREIDSAEVAMPQRRFPIRYWFCLIIILFIVVLFAWWKYKPVYAAHGFQDAFDKTLASEPQFAGSRAVVNDDNSVFINTSVPLANLNPFIDAVQQLRSNYPDALLIEAHIHVTLPPLTEMDFYKPASIADNTAFGNAAVQAIVTNPQFSHCEIHYLDSVGLFVLLAPAPLKDHQLFMDAITKHYSQNQPKPEVRRWPVDASSPLEVIFSSGQPPQMRSTLSVVYPS